MTKQTSASRYKNNFKPVKGSFHENPLQISELIGIIPAAGMLLQFEAAEGVGAINFLGKILPLVDLRMKMPLKYHECADHICILVMEDAVKKQSFLLAALVESELDAYQLVMESTH